MENLDYAKISSDNIRLLLQAHDMSIRQLADKISIAPTTLNDALKSKKGVSIDAMIKIAQYFHTTVNKLCCEEDNNQNFEDLTCDEFSKKFMLLNKHSKELVMLIINKELENI